MMVEQTFDTGVVVINYAEYGKEGTVAGWGSWSGPLVLLHGGSSGWRNSLLIPELSERFHVYAPDFRGHGKSGRVPGRYTVEDYATDTIMFLERVVREPAVIFGHSLGGQVGIVVAARRPDLVRALIIGDAPFDRSKLKAFLQGGRDRLETWRAMSGPGHSQGEVIEALKNAPIVVEGQKGLVPTRAVYGEDTLWYSDMAENLRLLDPGMLDAVLEFDEMHAALDCEELFPGIACPVLIIQANAALGGLLSDEEVQRACELLPRAAVARLETVGHPLAYPEREPLARAVLSFLDSLDV
jgi:pimeloyl-ACP methyl ester carboxylesterase